LNGVVDGEKEDAFDQKSEVDGSAGVVVVVVDGVLAPKVNADVDAVKG
jgi:hypothetical protein